MSDSKKVNALVIDPFKKSIYEKAIRQDNPFDIQQIIGDHFELAARLDNGDTLFCDENGLRKENQKGFRFANGHPIVGIGLLVGHNNDGASCDASINQLELAMKVEWL